MPLIELPLPAEPPVKPVPDGADHEYTVLLGITFGAVELGVTENEVELHVCVVISAIVGTGFTVTVNVNGNPEQVPETGIIVYVAECVILVELINIPEMVDAFVPLVPPVIPPVTVGAGQL